MQFRSWYGISKLCDWYQRVATPWSSQDGSFCGGCERLAKQHLELVEESGMVKNRSVELQPARIQQVNGTIVETYDPHQELFRVQIYWFQDDQPL